jgi:cation diffusion facilitator CzcD-associated flavoprotein CzcO
MGTALTPVSLGIPYGKGNHLQSLTEAEFITVWKVRNAFFYGMYRDHPMQLGLTQASREQMEERMKGIPDPEIVSKMLSLDIRPGCRRLTPGDGYLEAFSHDNATLTFDPIERITELGIKTLTGDEQQFDVIVCATGFDTSFIPSWKTVGRHGATLEERWKVNPEAFFAVQVDTMPNYFIFNGPNCPVSHGSLLTQVSWTCDYILRWAKKIAAEDRK